jgi:hypothetical protein
MRSTAWSLVITTLTLGCSSVNPHYEPTGSTMLSSSSITHAPALAQATTASPATSPLQSVSPSQPVNPWREDGTRVYRAAKPPVVSLNEALAAAQSRTVPQAAPAAETVTQVAMKPVQSPLSAPVAGPASPAPVPGPIASRPTAPSVTDALAAQVIQQTAASVPATPAEPKSSNQAAEHVRITSVVQDAGEPNPSK